MIDQVTFSVRSLVDEMVYIDSPVAPLIVNALTSPIDQCAAVVDFDRRHRGRVKFYQYNNVRACLCLCVKM